MTGGIACGKSTASAWLAAQGVQVLDTDQVAREVTADPEVLDAIRDYFGSAVFEASGSLDREALGREVFGSPEKRAVLNEIVHPEIGRRWRAWRAERQAAGEAAVVVIPLLFEVDATDGWDEVWCIAAPEPAVLQRLQDRGHSLDEAKERMASQWPIAEKCARADQVIENNQDLDEFHSRLRAAFNPCFLQKEQPYE